MSTLFFDLHFADYPQSVAAAGGVPVELSRDADVADVVARLDGLVLSGGADVDPALYGEDASADLGEIEPERDEWESALWRAARARHLPVLAICRGFQLVNVLHGGTLVQHVGLRDGEGHPQWDVDGRRPTHGLAVVAGTRTASVVGELTRVNSLHHQTVDAVGEGLVVSAIADDGVVEGLETTDGEVLAVQWHPELLTKPDPVFGWLVDEARRRPREPEPA
jgi:putative glutamine amidotransferase